MHDRTRPDPCGAATGTVYVAFFKLIEGTFIDQRDGPAMYEALGAKTDDTDKTKDNAQQDRRRGRGFVAGSRKSYLWDLPACISSGEEFAERHGRAIYEQVATEDEDDDARGAAGRAGRDRG